MHERLYNLKDVGRMLGGLCTREVRREIQAGRLAAKKRVTTRGTGKLPRLFVTGSAIDEYIRALPNAGTADVKANDGAFKRKDAKLQAELAAVPDRFAGRSSGHN
jgi:hypothetical protein